MSRNWQRIAQATNTPHPVSRGSERLAAYFSELLPVTGSQSFGPMCSIKWFRSIRRKTLIIYSSFFWKMMRTWGILVLGYAITHKLKRECFMEMIWNFAAIRGPSFIWVWVKNQQPEAHPNFGGNDAWPIAAALLMPWLWFQGTKTTKHKRESTVKNYLLWCSTASIHIP